MSQALATPQLAGTLPSDGANISSLAALPPVADLLDLSGATFAMLALPKASKTMSARLAPVAKPRCVKCATSKQQQQVSAVNTQKPDAVAAQVRGGCGRVSSGS